MCTYTYVYIDQKYSYFHPLHAAIHNYIKRHKSQFIVEFIDIKPENMGKIPMYFIEVVLYWIAGEERGHSNFTCW